MGWFSSLFRSSNDYMEWVDDSGVVRRRSLTSADKAKLKKATENGLAEFVDACIVHVIDPLRGHYAETWTIGREVSRETFERFSHEGFLYAATLYKDGKPTTSVYAKELWDQFRGLTS